MKVKKNHFQGMGNIFGTGRSGGLADVLNTKIDRDAASVVALTAITTANASDLPTAIALCNANKAAINAVIAAIKTNA